MAEVASAPNTAAVAPSTEEQTRPSAEVAPSAGAEDTGATGKAAGEDETAKDAALDSTEQQNDDDPSAKADETVKDGDTQDEAVPATANGGADNAKKDKKRRPSGVPEHKTKKLNKKKSMPDLHLNVQPGEYWYARMKGHPPWPSIVCDEELVPPALLEKRPVSAMRPDGSYREDFQEGGKNARDRRYPVMFLGTNEFAWQVNTDLLHLDMDELKGMVERNEQGKKSKSLWNAYEVASEEHDLDYFKGVLRDAEKARQEEIQKKEEAEAKKLEKKDKNKRKSTAAAVDDDVEMEDADGDGDAKKKSKKRKKDTESDLEGKPAKTQKTTKLKVNGPKPPKEETSKAKKSGKSKKAAKSSDSESPKPQEKPMTEAERKEKTQRSVLYLRHRLQKGFLNREDPPKEEEMPDMAEHFNNLESTSNLEASIIKGTKIHKVLKAIIKLGSIPRDDEFKFKERSQKLLSTWAKILASDLETPTTATTESAQEPATSEVKEGEAETTSEAPKTNGNAEDDTEMKDAPVETTKSEETGDKEQDSNEGVKSIESDTPKPAAVSAA